MIKKTKQIKSGKGKKKGERKEIYIKTGIDKLLSAIQEKRKLTLSEAAQMFGVSEELVEEWGNILERNDLIKMHYPIMGEPSLQTLELKKKKEGNEKKEEAKAVKKEKERKEKESEKKKKKEEAKAIKKKEEEAKTIKEEKKEMSDLKIKTELPKSAISKAKKYEPEPKTQPSVKKFKLHIKMPHISKKIIALVLVAITVSLSLSALFFTGNFYFFSYLIQEFLKSANLFVIFYLPQFVSQIGQFTILTKIYLILIILVPIIVIIIGFFAIRKFKISNKSSKSWKR